MTPKEVAASYDRLAARWAAPEFDRNNGIAAHRRALQFVPPGGIALDVGCGSSGRFADLLVAAGFTVEGVDLSAEMLRLARERRPELTFHHADVCSWQIPKQYSFITAWDSLWHVPLGQQRAVLLKLIDALLPNGVLIFTAGGIDAPDEHVSHAMGVPMYHASLGRKEIFRLIGDSEATCRHFEYDQWPENHVYLVVQRGPTSARST